MTEKEVKGKAHNHKTRRALRSSDMLWLWALTLPFQSSVGSK